MNFPMHPTDINRALGRVESELHSLTVILQEAKIDGDKRLEDHERRLRNLESLGTKAMGGFAVLTFLSHFITSRLLY